MIEYWWRLNPRPTGGARFINEPGLLWEFLGTAISARWTSSRCLSEGNPDEIRWWATRWELSGCSGIKRYHLRAQRVPDRVCA